MDEKLFNAVAEAALDLEAFGVSMFLTALEARGFIVVPREELKILLGELARDIRVPREPTEEMIQAVIDEEIGDTSDLPPGHLEDYRDTYKSIYKTMLKGVK